MHSPRPLVENPKAPTSRSHNVASTATATKGIRIALAPNIVIGDNVKDRKETVVEDDKGRKYLERPQLIEYHRTLLEGMKKK